MSELELHRYPTVASFEDAVLPYLLDREAEHNVILGICHQIKAGVYRDFWLTAVTDGQAIVGAAYRTPPFVLGLAHMDDDRAVDLTAGAARVDFGSLPAVVGAKASASRFASIWPALSGQTASLGMQQRIYRLTAVREAPSPDGRARPATETEAELLAQWIEAFAGETGAGAMHAPADWVAMRLAQDAASGLWVWEDAGEVVSMAAYTGPTPNGIRVNGVYTPPERRGHGYATSCVATLSAWLLSRGRTFCFLYTDLSNPTSNAVYQRIGYEPVVDVDQYAFGDP